MAAVFGPGEHSQRRTSHVHSRAQHRVATRAVARVKCARRRVHLHDGLEAFHVAAAEGAGVVVTGLHTDAIRDDLVAVANLTDGKTRALEITIGEVIAAHPPRIAESSLRERFHGLSLIHISEPTRLLS